MLKLGCIKKLNRNSSNKKIWEEGKHFLDEQEALLDTEINQNGTFKTYYKFENSKVNLTF